MSKNKKEEMLDDSIFQMEVLEDNQEEEQAEVPAKKKKGNKKILLFMLLGAVGIGALFAVAALAMTPKALPKVETLTLEKGDITSYLSVSGKVASQDVKTYFSPVNAPISSDTLKVGQIVSEGQQLVAFDTSDLERDNQKADLSEAVTVYGNQDTVKKAEETKAKAAAAVGKIESLESQIAQWQQYVQDCNTYITKRTAQLTDQGNNISLQIEQLGNEIADLTAQQQQLDVQYTEDPTNETYINERNNLQNQINAKNQSVYNLKVELNNVSNTSGNEDIIYYNNEISSAQNTIADLQSDLAEQEGYKSAGETGNISAEAKAQLDANSNLASLESSTIEELLEKGRRGITAEFTGVVTAVSGAVHGNTAAQGMELLTVSSTQDVAVEVTISKNDYDKVKEGQSAVITIGDKTYDGTVTSLSRVATQNEKGATVLSAIVRINNPDTELFLGVEAKVEINLGAEKDVLLAPMESINTDVDGEFCYVLENGVVTRRSVETGTQEDGNVQIVNGLEVTDVVIPTLPDAVAVGDSVQVMTETEKKAQQAYQEQIDAALQMYQ